MQAHRYWSVGDEISIWVFDVGQGDAIFIDADQDVLIDGGPSDAIIEKLTQVLPFWDRTIDLVVNTHPHADHLTGLVSVLRRYAVDQIWQTGQAHQTSFSDAFNELAGNSVPIQAGQRIEIDEAVTVEVLWPMRSLSGVRLEDPNDGSIVLLVECYDTRILLTGDIGIEQELSIIDRVGDIDVLKVAHQGSYTSSSLEFLQAVRPEVTIISVGENDYGHPHQEVLDRFTMMDMQIYRTDEDGDMRVICSRDGYAIKTY